MAIEKRLADRPLAAIVMIDALEHITNGPEVLTAFGELAHRQGGAPLVVAVPNVTHFDLGAKLLLGRWDMTETGLLDDTHVSFFSSGRLHEMTTQTGWSRSARTTSHCGSATSIFPPMPLFSRTGHPCTICCLTYASSRLMPP